MTMGRVYYSVPYLLREFAKRLGAHWDSTTRHWYADTEEVSARMQKFFPVCVPLHDFD